MHPSARTPEVCDLDYSPLFTTEIRCIRAVDDVLADAIPCPKTDILHSSFDLTQLAEFQSAGLAWPKFIIRIPRFAFWCQWATGNNGCNEQAVRCHSRCDCVTVDTGQYATCALVHVGFSFVCEPHRRTISCGRHTTLALLFQPTPKIVFNQFYCTSHPIASASQVFSTRFVWLNVNFDNALWTRQCFYCRWTRAHHYTLSAQVNFSALRVCSSITINRTNSYFDFL